MIQHTSGAVNNIRKRAPYALALDVPTSHLNVRAYIEKMELAEEVSRSGMAFVGDWPHTASSRVFNPYPFVIGITIESIVNTPTSLEESKISAPSLHPSIPLVSVRMYSCRRVAG